MAKGLTKRDKEVFSQLLEDGRMSDQEIARRIGTSRPTVARIRQKLEKKGFITGYLPRPNFDKMGLRIVSAIYYRWVDFSKKEELKRINEYTNNRPEVTSFFRGEGIGGKTNALISSHRTLDDHQAFLNDMRAQWKDNVADVEIFISSSSVPYKRYDVQDVIKEELRR